MAIAFSACNSGGGVQGANTTSGTVAWPAVQLGHVAFLWVAAPTGVTAFSTPTGFSSYRAFATVTNCQAQLFRKVCTGTESGNVTVSFTGGSNNNGAFILITFSGVDQTTPVLVDQATINTSTTASTTIATTAVSNTSTSACMLAFFAGGVATTTTSTWTESAGTEPTNGDVERHNGSTGSVSVAVCYTLNAAATSTTITGTRSVTSSAKAAYLGFLKPGPLIVPKKRKVIYQPAVNRAATY